MSVNPNFVEVTEIDRQAMQDSLGAQGLKIMHAIYPHFYPDVEKPLGGSNTALVHGNMLADLISQERQLSGKAQALLREISPRVLFGMERVLAAAAQAPRASYLRSAGLDRLLWSVGAAASGKSCDPRGVGKLVTIGSRLLAVRHAVSALQSSSDAIPLHVGSNPRLEEIRRHSHTEIRFMWVTRLICESIARQVQASPTLSQEMPEVTPGAVSEMFGVLIACQGDSYETFAHGLKKRPKALALARAMSIPAGSLNAEANLISLLHHRDAEIKPFIDFGQDEVIPVALRTASLRLDVALLELVRERASDVNAKGALYEAMLTECIRKVAPDDFVVLDMPGAVRVDKNNDGQVDFACKAGEGCLVIGEAKSYVVSRMSESVIQAFGDDISSAAKQLRVRLGAYLSGTPLLYAHGKVSKPDTPKGIGLAVPFHSYGTAVWNFNLLHEVGASAPGICIVPLHQLLILLQSVSNSKQFRKYLMWRSSRISNEVIVFDEIDLWIQFLADELVVKGGGVAASKNAGQLAIQRSYSVPVEVALNTNQPTDRTSWRQLLWVASHGNSSAAGLYDKLP